MNPWLRPSIQTPRRIAKAVKFIFAPLTSIVNYGKDYWDTWNQVYKPERKDDNK